MSKLIDSDVKCFYRAEKNNIQKASCKNKTVDQGRFIERKNEKTSDPYFLKEVVLFFFPIAKRAILFFRVKKVLI